MERKYRVVRNGKADYKTRSEIEELIRKKFSGRDAGLTDSDFKRLTNTYVYIVDETSPLNQ